MNVLQKIGFLSASTTMLAIYVTIMIVLGVIAYSVLLGSITSLSYSLTVKLLKINNKNALHFFLIFLITIISMVLMLIIAHFVL